MTFEFWTGKKWKPKNPTPQPKEVGYARYQFRCKRQREEEIARLRSELEASAPQLEELRTAGEKAAARAEAA